MAIQELTDNTILIELPSQNTKIAEELKAVNKTISEASACNIIIDFSRVEILASSNISNLLIMRSLLHDLGHKLILCNVSTMTKCIFVVAGLSEIFNFADNTTSALAELQGVH